MVRSRNQSARVVLPACAVLPACVVLAGCVVLSAAVAGCSTAGREAPTRALAAAPATLPEIVADRYLRAITDRDWEAMASFLDERSTYRDDTMTFFGGEPIDLEGVESIVDFWRTSSEDTDARVDNRVRSRFTAGDWVVLVLRPFVSVDGELWDVPGRRIEGSFDQVTILRVRGGKILHHVDHVDYAALMGHVEAARAAAHP